MGSTCFCGNSWTSAPIKSRLCCYKCAGSLLAACDAIMPESFKALVMEDTGKSSLTGEVECMIFEDMKKLVEFSVAKLQKDFNFNVTHPINGNDLIKTYRDEALWKAFDYVDARLLHLQ